MCAGTRLFNFDKELCVQTLKGGEEVAMLIARGYVQNRKKGWGIVAHLKI